MHARLVGVSQLDRFDESGGALFGPQSCQEQREHFILRDAELRAHGLSRSLRQWSRDAVGDYGDPLCAEAEVSQLFQLGGADRYDAVDPWGDRADEEPAVEGSGQPYPSVLDGDVGCSRAGGHEMADDLRVDARRQDDFRLLPPEPVRASDAADVCARTHSYETHRHALFLEGFEMWPAVTERGYIWIEAESFEFRQQKSELALAAADAERRAQNKHPGQLRASS
jgi:hypothetical protein